MLSVVITAWNEAANLPRAVKSVSGLADEIVVVDTESTDDTIAVAKKLGCKVFSHPNTGIVEPVRNFSISKASGNWILLLDADEEVSPALAKAIHQAMTSDAADYFRLPRKNLIFGKWITSSHWWPDYVYRLFKKGFIVWNEAIHSVPMTRGRGADFPARENSAIIHHHYQNIDQYLERINRYTDHQLKLLQEHHVEFSWSQLVTQPSQEFIRQFFARGGYKDGVHGLALAGLQGFSELVLYLKLWQNTGFKPEPVPLSQFRLAATGQIKHFWWWFYEELGKSGNFLLQPMYKLLRKLKSFQI
jgi:(heptosyl)LPS beta-1,4-glucosyltransferase